MNSITDRLRVAVLPLDIVQNDREANLRAVETALDTLPCGTDIAVLPELFSTGFEPDGAVLASIAERNTQCTVDALRSWAARCECAFAGSFLASTPPKLYNRGFFIEPNGDETYYDKAHLFGVSSEAKLLAAGTSEPPSVRFRGWNVSLGICYDLRFPAWCRNRGCRYDIMLFPANWPQAREYAWTQLLIARAIENQAATVGADRGGEDKFGVYDGMTRFFDARGEATGGISGDGPWYVAEFSKAVQNEYRRKFPVLADADDYSFG